MSFLVIDKSKFKEELKNQSDKGIDMINRILKEKNFDKFNSKVADWNDYNHELLKQAFDNPENEYLIEYQKIAKDLAIKTVITKDTDLNSVLHELLKNQLFYIKRLIAKADLIRSYNQEDEKKSNNTNKNEVFIVHGHDEIAKTKTARLIEKLGFKPIILHEQASAGNTIIEKIEEYSNVGFGIVLYTPCDIGGKNEDKPKLQNRARQNVIFEHGFLIGKIGRKNVCALVKEEVETPNDISGVVYIKMDSDDAWEIKVAKELKKSGYEVDLNKL